MISVSSLETFREQGDGVPSELDSPTLPTVILQQTDCPALFWSLRLTEFFSNASGALATDPASIGGPRTWSAVLWGKPGERRQRTDVGRVAAGSARQRFIELTSPDAVILGWSHEPCTDVALYFGTASAAR